MKTALPLPVSDTLLRHREDRRPVAFLLGFVLYQFLVFALAPTVGIALLLVAMPHALLHVALMNVLHFSTHNPLFRDRRIEFAFCVIGSLALGFTRQCFRFDHLAHHRHYLDPALDTNVQVETGPLRRQRYALNHLLSVYPRTWRMARQAGGREWFEYRAEMAAVLAIVMVLALARPSVALAVFVVPMVYNIFAVYYWSHHQHAGLHSTDPLTASRTYENRWFNWISFNVGYHAAHHYRPGLHWSKLPALHASLRGRIPDELVLPSIPWFASEYRRSRIGIRATKRS